MQDANASPDRRVLQTSTTMGILAISESKRGRIVARLAGGGSHERNYVTTVLIVQSPLQYNGFFTHLSVLLQIQYNGTHSAEPPSQRPSMRTVDERQASLTTQLSNLSVLPCGLE
jgi:hypothetical protein